MTTFHTTTRRADEIETIRSATFWAPVIMSRAAYDAANLHLNGAQSPIPGATTDNVTVYAASRRSAEAFAALVNIVVAAQTGVARQDAIAI